MSSYILKFFILSSANKHLSYEKQFSIGKGREYLQIVRKILNGKLKIIRNGIF